MAPSVQYSESPWSTASYMPPDDSIASLKQALRLSHMKQNNSPCTWVTEGAQAIDSHDRDEEPPDWLLQLTLSDLQEIEDAVTYFKATNLPHNQIRAESFPLPTLRAKIRERSMLLHNEKPFFLIRGLKPQWFTKEKNVIIYLGIASHVGTKRAMAKGDSTVLQVPDGDEEKWFRGPANRNIAIPFHNDYGEILSLYTLSRPASGGEFYLADINDIAARIELRRPDLLETLQKSFSMAAPGYDCGFEERPLLFNTPSNNLVAQVSRSRLCNGIRPRPRTIPPLSEKQVQAIDALHVVGMDVAQRFSFLGGDMLFFNNLRMMHSRDSFVDGCEEDNTTYRYLLRLILKDDLNDGWEVPPEMGQTWRTLYDHEDREEIIPVYPSLFSFKAAH